jgi:4-hydroxy 2-oxovalerate aldolase
VRSIKILDCTLRDGGYVNDWNFGMGSIKSIISRLDYAGIDIIEIGFLDSRRIYDENRSIVPDTDSLKPIFEDLGVVNAMTLSMIDFGTCGLEFVKDKKDTPIDGIRVIFKKKDCIAAIDFCMELKKKGYKIFLQPVSVTTYSDDEMRELIKIVNKVGPFGIYIVDTYGLMHKKEMLHYFSIMDENLQKDIYIGYHAHNNFQLAYANCTELMEIDSERALIVDSTLYGMGKSAGNACTELLANYLNENYGKQYKMDQLLEAIDVDISKEYAKKYWGYSFMHFIAASNDCHPDYVSALINKKTLSVKSVNEILSKIENDKKLTFNKDLLEDMYIQYQSVSIDDHDAYNRLKKDFENREILVIAPGNSIETHKEKISGFIKEKNPLIIAINFLLDDVKADYVFMGNAKRYSQFYNRIYKHDSNIKVICTSNISESNKQIDFKLNFNALLCKDDVIRDNPVLMLLKALVKMKIKSTHLAGFDGYSPDLARNYIGEYIQFLYCDDNVLLRNEAVKKELEEIEKNVKLEFMTPSYYIDKEKN